jgi:hypothetical protein
VRDYFVVSFDFCLECEMDTDEMNRVDKAGDKDYHKCYQVSGLGPVTGDGYAQISYKTSCSGACAASYSS